MAPEFILNSAFASRHGQFMFPCALPNPVKVSFGERCDRLIGSLQEPSFKLRRDFERLALLSKPQRA